MTLNRGMLLLAGLLVGLCFPVGISYGQNAESALSRHISVKDDLLNVELKDAAFGEVMTEIARKAGFEVDISSAIYKKKVSTKFTNVDMQRGLLRLLALISQKTYFIYYNSDGSIKRVEVYGFAAGSPVYKPEPERSRSKSPRSLRTKPSRPQENLPPPEILDEILGEPEDAPYIPPKREPVYIPPPGI